MGLRSWWNKLRQHEDDERIKRALEESFETPAERAEAGEDRLARGADTKSAGSAGETIEDADRLGDAE